jgi:23S rRNA pseudouridine955/2504/2580 synthase
MSQKLIKNLLVFEDENYLILNKPSGVSSLHDRNIPGSSIIDLIKSISEEYQLCHRLDKETSGALLISKNSDAYRHAAKSFEHRKVEKTYTAFCKGIHNFDQVNIELPIAVSGKGKVRIDKNTGKPSLTIVNTQEVANQHTMVSCKPLTGRMHQIRIHLAAVGAPICCDSMYGGEKTYLSEVKRKFKPNRTGEEKPLLDRVALHASALSFFGLNDKVIEVEAPLPKDLAAFWRQLNKW